jgi:hypothetical protein
MHTLVLPSQKAPPPYVSGVSGIPRLFQGVGTCSVIDYQLITQVDDLAARHYISGIVKDFGRQWEVMAVEAFDAALAPLLDAAAPLEGYTQFPSRMVNGREIRVAVGPVQNKNAQSEITRILRMLEHIKILATTVEGAMAEVLGQQQNKVSLQIGQLQRQILSVRNNPERLEPRRLQESVNRITETVKSLPPVARAAFADILKQITALPQSPLFSPAPIQALETPKASSPMPPQVAAKIESTQPILAPNTTPESVLPQRQAQAPTETAAPLQAEIKIQAIEKKFEPPEVRKIIEITVPEEHKAEPLNEITLPAKLEAKEELPEIRVEGPLKTGQTEELKTIPLQSSTELPVILEITDTPKDSLRSGPLIADIAKEPDPVEKLPLRDLRETRPPEKELPIEKTEPPPREESKERIKAEFRENKEIVCNMGHTGCTINHKLGEDTAPKAETVSGQIIFGGEEKKSVQADFQKTAGEIVCNMGHVGCTINHKLGEDTAPKAETVTGKINFGVIPAAATVVPPQAQLHRHPT